MGNEVIYTWMIQSQIWHMKPLTNGRNCSKFFLKVSFEVLLPSRGREGGVRLENASTSLVWFCGSVWLVMSVLASDM